MIRPKILVVTIATGKYLGYFERNLPGWRRAFGAAGEVTFQVLTDSIREGGHNLGPDVEVMFQKQLEWPMITLLRYEILLSQVNFSSFDFVVWLDADMEAVGNVPASIFEHRSIVLARHPGYELPIIRPSRKSWPSRILSVIAILIRANTGYFALGDWECRESSTAFVPRKSRKSYVHGAVWLGPSMELREMCSLLAERTSEDLRNGIIAIWHDESHLNWYAANFKPVLADLGFSDWEESTNFGTRPTIFLSQDKAVLDAAFNDGDGEDLS
ncbi:hypothetical protein [Aquiluna sp. KACHI24]|uniref:hypothetical protein n=1 Tax=Aquiluna sp. KACHI24 TaxID=2968831 RepID=UPI00220BFF52|nr:hypothetical protein [Aquiluna sp. KACHI24]BDQ00535.1 hypothetical protein AKACHI_08710 [Aquiluna sp. KACHI24]